MPDDVLVHASLHRLEQLEALALVLDERVALAVAAQPDAFLQMVEAVEVILPLAVHHLQHDVALDALQEIAPDQLLLRLVVGLDALPDRVADLAAAERAHVDPGEVLLGEAEDARDLLAKRRNVPRLDVGLGADVAIGDVVEQVLRETHHVPASVDRVVALVSDADDAFEQLAAQRVDVLTLLVHHVVVLEQVLAGGEVLRFHLLLRPLDGARHHPVLDGNAFLHPEPLHQARDAIRPEDAHQVVFEGQVEARRARIALAAGTAAQLVVDATGLVAFGAEDVQAAGPDDLGVLGLALALEVREDPLPVGVAARGRSCRGGRSRRTGRRLRTALRPSAAARPLPRPATAGAP